MITEVKMQVTPDLSRRVQEIVFANNGTWDHQSNRDIRDLDLPCLYINSSGYITGTFDKKAFDKSSFREVSAYDFIASNGEQHWLPRYNELAEFSNEKKSWKTGIFKRYLPEHKYGFKDKELCSYKYCREIPKTKTIVLGDKEIEISIESFNELKKQLCKD